MRILVVTNHYLPGYKAGGPIRTLASVTDALGDEFEFLVLTSDRDLSGPPYSSIQPGVWQRVGKAQVLYLRSTERRWACWKRRLNALDFDVIYLNSCFSRLTIRTLALRWLKLIPSKPIVLAPRGEFSPGALGLKKYKKKLYLALTKVLNFYQDIVWQASSAYEREDIAHAMQGKNPIVVVAQDLVPVRKRNSDIVFKDVGALKLVFLSRVSRKKNLDYALRLLSGLTGRVIFDIYGPLEDLAYWKECQSIIAQMPPSIEVTYRGEIMPEQVMDTFGNYHLFLFPTRGENFGHVISEALRAGCPVLISDTTPWRGLEEQKAGWIVPLSQPERFITILENMLQMDDAAFREYADHARRFGETAANDPAVIEANRTLFLTAAKCN
ncbi:MAG: glycosyltransferase [Anaerolineae bacterium]|nr:glycosyltransferase [Anaerolineae bacterium]